jgi:CRP-like cAMP-binding protein
MFCCALYPPPAESFRITTHTFASHTVLISADKAPDTLFFPERGAVISVTRSVENGATVEVGIVGSEGLVSIETLFSPAARGAEGVVQIAGRISSVPLAAFREAFSDAAVRDVVLRYASAFLTQVSQHAVCNRLHTIEQRLAKWLLGVQDRIDSNHIGLTQDFLSHMLGIRRSGVSIALSELTLAGVLDHTRGSVTVIDRQGLERYACECYRILRETAA